MFVGLNGLVREGEGLEKKRGVKPCPHERAVPGPLSASLGGQTTEMPVKRLSRAQAIPAVLSINDDTARCKNTASVVIDINVMELNKDKI